MKTYNIFTSRFAQTGRSMIEMLGVLAIIGVLSVGGIAGYSKAMTQYRVNKTIEQINTIAAGIQTLYANQNDYTGLDNRVVEKAKIVPDEMLQGHGIILAINAPLYIYPNRGGGGGFGLSTQRGAITTDTCIYLLTHNWQDNSNLVAIVGGQIMLANPDISNCKTVSSSTVGMQCMSDGPVSLEKATAWCTARGPAWTFLFR